MPEFLIDALADMSVTRALFLAVSGAALVSIPVYLFADAVRADFDPRPALHRALESRAGDRVLVEIVRARMTGALALLALAQLLDPSSPSSAPKKGAHHA